VTVTTFQIANAAAHEPPKRVAILAFENLEKAQAALTSAAFKDARAIGEKYAKFRAFAVEGVSQ
jgi:uncharacterized protein (DUF1330 family)